MSGYLTEKQIQIEVATREARRVLQEARDSGEIAPIDPNSLTSNSLETGNSPEEAQDLYELKQRLTGGWNTSQRLLSGRTKK